MSITGSSGRVLTQVKVYRILLVGISRAEALGRVDGVSYKKVYGRFAGTTIKNLADTTR